MAQTIDALGRKIDVKTRLNETVSAGADHAKGIALDAAAKTTDAGRRLQTLVQRENSPVLPVAAVGVAVLVVAMVLASRRSRSR